MIIRRCACRGNAAGRPCSSERVPSSPPRKGCRSRAACAEHAPHCRGGLIVRLRAAAADAPCSSRRSRSPSSSGRLRGAARGRGARGRGGGQEVRQDGRAGRVASTTGAATRHGHSRGWLVTPLPCMPPAMQRCLLRRRGPRRVPGLANVEGAARCKHEARGARTLVKLLAVGVDPRHIEDVHEDAHPSPSFCFLCRPPRPTFAKQQPSRPAWAAWP